MRENLDELEKDIRRLLTNGNATLAIDRLHTLIIKKMRQYCINHDINIVNEKNEAYPIHSLIGMLVKYYKNNNMISDFTEFSLKQSISLYEKFNDIRNNKSYAHDNTVLSNEESLYIIKSVINMLNFLNYIETGESQLISSSIVKIEDIYKYICINDIVTTKSIATHFNISIEEVKQMVMELYKVNGKIRPAHLFINYDDENCQWIRV